MTRFLIKKGDIYYLTSGELLIYDEVKAKEEKEKKGVKLVKEEFARIEKLPHTWHKAVEITDSSFSPSNTGQV